MQPIPNNTIVYYASSDPKYTGSVGIITSGFISPKSEILTQDVKFAFGTFRHEFTHLHEVKKFTDKQKQSLEKLKLIHPHLFKDNEMRNFQIGDWVTHSDYSIDGTVKGARSATGHYPVILDSGQEIKAHEDKLTQKNNVTALELAERRIPGINQAIKEFLATDLAQQLSPAQRDAINKPGNYTTWKLLTAALIKADLEKQAMEFINEKIPKSILLELKPNSVIIDTETTGLDGDAEICEISIIDVFGNVVLDGLIKPSKPVPDAAIAVHGITNEMLEHAPTFDEISDRIIAALKGKDIIVYNAQYDMRLLIQSARLANVSTAMYQDLALKARCSMLAYSSWYGEIGNYNKPKWHKLVAACQQQKIDISSITAHRAKADCLMTLELIKNCKFKYEMDASDATKEKQTTDTVPTSTAQQPEAVGSDAKPSQENSQATTEVVPQVELAQLVRNTNAIIEIDVVSAIEYIDSRVTTFVGESEALEAELKKWFKDLAVLRLDLTRPVKESLQTVIDDEKRIGAYLEKIFAANAAKREAVEKERKAKKYTEVMATMADMLNTVDLPPEYLAKVVFREEYYQVTFKGKKLAESIQEQINTQVSLYNGYLAELELKQARIANRELLIKSYNIQYDADGTYSMFTIEMFSDDQVLAKYEQNYQRKLKLEQERLNAEKANEVKTSAYVQAADSGSWGSSDANTKLEVEQKNSKMVEMAQKIPSLIDNGLAEVETVIMFKLVVTGRTQADHERLLPKFIDKINAAVDGGLAPAVNAGFGYKFEVVE